jgi:hypothetical protein
MSEGGEVDDLEAALADAFRVGEVVDAADLKKRKAREKRMSLPSDDGRRRRATGRTVQFNVKMRPELKRRVVHAARERNTSITVLCEEAFELLLSRKGGKHA